jgi:2-phosphosulfolactate phosphatase
VSPPGALTFQPSHFQHGFGARMEWGRTGVGILARQATLVVIVDVLSFSTAVSVAVEHGAAVVPHPSYDETAERLAQSLGATLAGRRGGPGPSLSPASLSALRPGDALVLPSPNGSTCSVLAADGGATVVAGCLRNATAVGRLAVALGGTTAVIPAGEAWPDGSLRPAVEDLIGAGAILSAFGPDTLSPEASAAVAAFRAVRGDLRWALGSAVSGRELIDAGFGDDVAIAAQLDATDLVPELRDGRFRSR